MTHNDFIFNKERFLQIFGTAMGKTFAPNLANIYVLDLDRQAMGGFRIKPTMFFRYLDDIPMVVLMLANGTDRPFLHTV